jgi:putative endonuclease
LRQVQGRQHLSEPLTRATRGATGRSAEDLAVALLQARGFTVIARNWRRPEGELDVVADDRGTCVFVEVRSRTGQEFGHPLESINPRKRAQIIRAARLYLDQEPTQAVGFRFDVVGVTFFGDERAPECVHIEDAFQVE